MAFPDTDADIACQYTFDERDLAIIRHRRGAHNRLGFAVQLCYLRYPGQTMASDVVPPAALLAYVAEQLHLDPAIWTAYAQRDETRRDGSLFTQNAAAEVGL